MPSRTAGRSRCWRQRIHALAEGLAAARVMETSREHAIPAPSRDIDPERAHGEPDAGELARSVRMTAARRRPAEGRRRRLAANSARAGSVPALSLSAENGTPRRRGRRHRTLDTAPSFIETTSGSAGRDCCSPTKPAVCGRSTEPPLAIELDEQEQSGLPLPRCMVAVAQTGPRTGVSISRGTTLVAPTTNAAIVGLRRGKTAKSAVFVPPLRLQRLSAYFCNSLHG